MLRVAPTQSKGFRSSPLLLVRLYLQSLGACLTVARTAELELEEDRTCVSLTIVDTPGFGDEIDNEARYEVMTLKP